jgi:hypothetical protein
MYCTVRKPHAEPQKATRKGSLDKMTYAYGNKDDIVFPVDGNHLRKLRRVILHDNNDEVAVKLMRNIVAQSKV